MSDFHNAKTLPQTGIVGDLYRVSSTGDLFIAIADGRLVPISLLLAGPPIQGIDGATGPQGPKGEKGDTGGIGAQGPKGDKGEPGDICYIGPAQVRAAYEKLRAELLQVHAQLANARNENAANRARARRGR